MATFGFGTRLCKKSSHAHSFLSGVYYVMPLSLLTMNFTLLLNLFFLLLLGMLLGLVLLSLNIEHLLEFILVELFLFWEKVAVKQVVLKNLIAHRQRNRKTTIMYALALGFIIFIMVSYSSVLDSVSYQKQATLGTLVKVKPSFSLYYFFVVKIFLSIFLICFCIYYIIC